MREKLSMSFYLCIYLEVRLQITEQFQYEILIETKNSLKHFDAQMNECVVEKT